jgi:2-polyprenyl-3-methyl-5-hydroxy-6-metoxy-1,4-benzoquinol methylase
MTIETTGPADASTAPADAPTLDERIFSAALGTLELFGLYLGTRLGLYEVLHRDGPVTADGLADRAGIHPRYAREWLEQQAAAGYVTVAGGVDAPTRSFALPREHAGVLVEPTSADHVAPFAPMLVGIANVLDEVVAAYRSGGGVPYARYGADFRAGQGAINRPAFETALVDEWLPAAGLADTLRAGGRIADIGCGQGWSTMAVARAFPEAEVWGIDMDAASIEDARAIAGAGELRVRFEAADAARLASHGPFDGALLLEALHDLSRPVDVLAAARAALVDGGTLVVADEAVAEDFRAPADDLERMMYGWSIVHCLPASMAEQPSAAIGTVIRERTVRELAQQAGFSRVDVLPVDGGFFRIYALVK